MTVTKVILALNILVTAGALPLQEDVTAVSESKQKQTNYRLPDNVKSLHYELALWSYMTENFTFDETVAIDIEILSPTQDKILHKDELDIHEDFTTLTQESDSNVFVSFVLCEGLRGANDTVWNNLLNLVHEQGDKYDESLYTAFYCVENKVAIEHVINLVLTTDMLESSHAMFEGSPVFFTRNPVAVNIIIDYIIEHCNELESMKENRTNVRKIVIDMLSSNVYSSQELAKARTLFSACNIEYDEEVLSDVEKRITEAEREVSKILNWFHEATARQNAT